MYACLIPPFSGCSFPSCCAFSLSRFRGLKFSRTGSRSESGFGFLAPKKTEGVGARDKGRALGVDLGLGALAGSPVGLNVLAAGFGRNSVALTLNFAEAAEVGVRTLLEF